MHLLKSILLLLALTTASLSDVAEQAGLVLCFNATGDIHIEAEHQGKCDTQKHEEDHEGEHHDECEESNDVSSHTGNPVLSRKECCKSCVDYPLVGFGELRLTSSQELINPKTIPLNNSFVPQIVLSHPTNKGPPKYQHLHNKPNSQTLHFLSTVILTI
ncbi:MAG: hypothetical protein HQL32_16925 [Planctomycetes bacterium]|nr:hypothetical protein [Planctomycetota bacterium]